jgi:hypothetical protein
MSPPRFFPVMLLAPVVTKSLLIVASCPALAGCARLGGAMQAVSAQWCAGRPAPPS